MPLVLDTCTDADMPRITDILISAFGTEHPYIEAYFPNKNTPEGRASAIARLTETKNTDPTSHFLKVTDTDAGEIIGMAKWYVYEDETKKPEEVGLNGDYWENEEEKAFANHLYGEFLAQRRKLFRETDGPVACLDLLTVDPKHQYRGAGRMLVRWGTDRADEIGAQCTVEAWLAGRHLYEQCGFINRQHITLAVPNKWADRPKQRLFWMVRPAKASVEST